MSRRTARAISLAVALLLALGGLGAGPDATAAEPAMTPCRAGTPLASDFDGDGLADLVIGSGSYTPAAGLGGAEWVQPGDGGSATWLADTTNLVSADLNGDVCADAIMAPANDADERDSAWLEFVPGTEAGLDLAAATRVRVPQVTDQYVHSEGENSAQVKAAGLRHDGRSQVVAAVTRFMERDAVDTFLDVFTLDDALAVSDTQVFAYPSTSRTFEALATDGGTVAVGVPDATVNGRDDAGAAYLYTPDATRPETLVRRLILTQNSAGIPGKADVDDRFGSSLAFRDGRLAIGVPYEDDGGAVQPILWRESTHTYRAYRRIDQDTRGVPGTNEPGDGFGSGLRIARGLTASGSYDILISAGGEDYGKLSSAGSVTVANFTQARYRGYTQATAGIPGTPATDNHFGWALGVLRSSSGPDTVLIGAPGDGIGRVIRSNGTTLTSKTLWTNVDVPPGGPEGLRNWGISVGTDG